MSHNTVVVDGVASGLDPLHVGHRLLAYGTDGAGFHLAAAESATAYPGLASRYRRTLAVIGGDSRDAYVVDVFEVRGGRQHDWLLHGPRDADAVAEAPGVDWHPYDGTLLNEGVAFSPPRSFQHPNPPGFWFGFIRDLRRAPVRGAVTLDFRLENEPAIGTRTLLAGLDDAEFFAGRAPDIRRARETTAALDRTTAPVFCIRRRGRDLESVFAAIHEPVRGEPAVRAVTATRAGGALLLRVDRGPRGTDCFAMATEDGAAARFETPRGGMEIEGRYAWVRLDSSGTPRAARLFDASRVRFGGMRIEGRAGWRGTVLEWDVRGRREGSRGSFLVDQAIDRPGTGTFMLTFADGTVWPFNVVDIEPAAGGSRVHVREKPAFAVSGGKTRITAYPQREVDGTDLRFSLPRLVSWNGVSPPP
jgi:hypothetical protein